MISPLFLAATWYVMKITSQSAAEVAVGHPVRNSKPLFHCLFTTPQHAYMPPASMPHSSPYDPQTTPFYPGDDSDAVLAEAAHFAGGLAHQHQVPVTIAHECPGFNSHSFFRWKTNMMCQTTKTLMYQIITRTLVQAMSLSSLERPSVGCLRLVLMHR